MGAAGMTHAQLQENPEDGSGAGDAPTQAPNAGNGVGGLTKGHQILRYWEREVFCWGRVVANGNRERTGTKRSVLAVAAAT